MDALFWEWTHRWERDGLSRDQIVRNWELVIAICRALERML